MTLNGNTQHGQCCLSSCHSWQMCRSPGSCNDDFNTSGLCLIRKLSQPSGCAVCGDDATLVSHAELGQHFVGVPHGLPVGFTTHDNGDQRLSDLSHYSLVSLRLSFTAKPYCITGQQKVKPRPGCELRQTLGCSNGDPSPHDQLAKGVALDILASVTTIDASLRRGQSVIRGKVHG